MFSLRTPRKTVGPVSDKIGGHKRTTGEAGIANDGVSCSVVSEIGFTVEIGDSIIHSASYSSCHLGYTLWMFHS